MGNEDIATEKTVSNGGIGKQKGFEEHEGSMTMLIQRVKNQ